MLHIYYGPESGGRLYRIRQVEKSLRDIHNDRLLVRRYYLSETKLENILSDLDTGELFASHTLAIINNAELVSKKQDIQILSAFIPGHHTTLLLNSDSDRLDKSLLSLAGNRAQECFRELTDSQKEHWVNRYLEKQNFYIPPEALELFLSLVSSDTQDMKQELDKILLLFNVSNLTPDESDERVLSSELIEKYIYHSREESVFTLFAAYSEGNFAKALEILNKLRSTKANEETSILIRMGYQLRQLATLSDIQRQRRLDNSDFRNARVFGSTNIAQYRAVLNRLDHVRIRRQLVLCSEFEIMLRQHKQAIHHHIIQLWLYSLFFPSWKMETRDKRLFTVDHQRFG